MGIGVERLGIVDHAQSVARRFAERHPSLKRRILGMAPDFSNAKSAHITVNAATGERSFSKFDTHTPPRIIKVLSRKPAPEGLPPNIPFIRNPEAQAELTRIEKMENIQPPRVGEILEAVAEAAGVTVAQIVGISRARKYAWPRQVAMALVAELRPDLSTVKIGFLFGKRDHTTVIHGRDTARDRIDTDPETARIYGTALGILRKAHPEMKEAA